jgi:hypothetical protein
MGTAHLGSGILGVSESPRNITEQWPAAAVPACPAASAAGYGRARSTYIRRRPEDTVLHRVVREHLETFLAEAQRRDGGDGLPAFVEREFRECLSCGVLARGFARFRCTDCQREILVAFSCKGRGFCPSGCGRRMAELAAHLVDGVLGGVRAHRRLASRLRRLGRGAPGAAHDNPAAPRLHRRRRWDRPARRLARLDRRFVRPVVYGSGSGFPRSVGNV